jgi:hypothetical protein
VLDRRAIVVENLARNDELVLERELRRRQVHRGRRVRVEHHRAGRDCARAHVVADERRAEAVLTGAARFLAREQKFVAAIDAAQWPQLL